MKKKVRINIFLLFLVGIFLFTLPVFAKKTLGDAAGNLGAVVTPSGVSTKTIQVQLGDFIRIALSITGTVFFVLMVYAGFKWMTARGSEEEITKARGTIIAAVIGLAIVVSAYSITTFVTNQLLGQKDAPAGVCVSLCSTLGTTACTTASQYCEVQANTCTQKGGDDCASKSQSQCTTPCQWKS